ncbi:hypothetical protein [Sphingomonas sp. TX0522]|uniref:hypothetical protein n=1 Tax=Sphingomonas sp. TX0522 TaxID=2479205 RepID=UPI0018E03F83|nr:hypothetical protein [Sphingomonas sp. TX0522]
MKRVKPAADVDLLYGLAAIGSHIGLTSRQAEHLIAKGEIPTFKMGRTVCARQSELEAHFARASTAARGGADPTPSPTTAPPSPALLYGHRAIAAHLGIPAADVTRLDAERRLPTYQDDGCTVASTAALDHWNSTKGGR